MKALRPVIEINRVPYLQMTSVGSHSSSGRKREEIKERLGHLLEWKGIAYVYVFVTT